MVGVEWSTVEDVGEDDVGAQCVLDKERRLEPVEAAEDHVCDRLVGLCFGLRTKS